MKKTLLSVALALLSTTGFAQYITEAPAGGFDFSKGKDYVAIYVPAAQVTAIGDKMLSNQNLDPDMVKNQFYYWVCDWSEEVKNQFTLYNVDDDTPNSWGGEDNIDMTPLWWWGGGNFTPKSQKYDLSAITDEHILHIGFCDIGGAPSKPRMLVGLTTDNGFPLQVGYEVGKPAGKYIGIGTFAKQKTWYYIDVPVKDLIDEDGDFGFEYSFGDNIDKSIFTIDFGSKEADVTITNYSYGAIDPETGMKTVNISQVGNALSLDAIFFYKADESAGVNEVKAATKVQDNAIYNLAGQQVSKDYKGVVVKNGRKYIQ